MDTIAHDRGEGSGEGASAHLGALPDLDLPAPERRQSPVVEGLVHERRQATLARTRGRPAVRARAGSTRHGTPRRPERCLLQMQVRQRKAYDDGCQGSRLSMVVDGRGS